MKKSVAVDDEAPVIAVPEISSKKVESKASKESSIRHRQSDQFLSKKKKKRSSSSIKKSKSFAGTPTSSASSSDPTDPSTVHPPFCIEPMASSRMLVEKKQKRSSKAQSAITKPSPEINDEASAMGSQNLSKKKKKRSSSSIKKSKSFAGTPTSSASLDPTDPSTVHPPFCIEPMASSRMLVEKKQKRSSKKAQSAITSKPSPEGSQKRSSKKVKSKASKESSIPRRRQSDHILSKKKKRSSSSMKKSKSFSAEQPSASSNPQRPSFSLLLSPIKFGSKQRKSSKNSVKIGSVLASQLLQEINEASVMASPKRSNSTKSKKVKSKASKASSIARRQSDLSLLSNNNKKNGSNIIKKSKSFSGQPSSASASRPPNALLAVMELKASKKPKEKRPSSTKTKKLKSKSINIPHSRSEQSLRKRNSSTSNNKTGGGMKRNKSFSHSDGDHHAKSLIDDALITRRSISKQTTPKRASKTKVKKENNGNSGSELLLSPVDITSSIRYGGDRRVSFHEKIRFKKIKHSKVDQDLIWYSNEEIKANVKREEEVNRQARSCHNNNASVLNLEGLLTRSEWKAMIQRQIESREAVYEVQDAHRRHKELEASTALFRGKGTYMESTLMDFYEQDEAIAEQYEIFTVAAIQCAQQRATHLALHVNLMWDKNFESNTGTEGWHGIKFIGCAPTKSPHRSSSNMLMPAQ